MITIIDYGMGNLGSIKNMLKWINVRSIITSDMEEIKYAEKILLPGVGAYDTAMNKINEMGLKELLDEKVIKERVPILGICLGMQLLTTKSEEGKLNGLNYIPAQTKRFSFISNRYKVPHMGWNTVKLNNTSRIIDMLSEEARFYFVHSYYVSVDNDDYSVYKTNYGEIKFDSLIAKGNIYGAQFHPEKSHKFGMQLFKNFVKI